MEPEELLLPVVLVMIPGLVLPVLYWLKVVGPVAAPVPRLVHLAARLLQV